MKKKRVILENYLERIPIRPDTIRWSAHADGKVTLQIENRGAFHWLAQKLFLKPKTSYVHLDEMGSFVWPLLDGEKSIMDLGRDVEETFGDLQSIFRFWIAMGLLIGKRTNLKALAAASAFVIGKLMFVCGILLCHLHIGNNQFSSMVMGDF